MSTAEVVSVVEPLGAPAVEPAGADVAAAAWDSVAALEPTGERAVEPASAPAPESFEYAVLRAVPRVERGEFVNVGVVLYCQQRDFLGVAVHVDPARILALDPSCDVDGVAALLDGVAGICEGGARAGQAVVEPMGRRFRWLIAPRSTVVQPGPVHTGVTADPAGSLERLLATLVLSTD